MAAEPSRGGALAADALVGGALLGLLGLFVVADGGFDPTVWQPAGLFALALGAVIAIGRPEVARELPRATIVALAALAAFTAWSYASVVWADSRGEAWAGANRALLYLLVYALFATWPWPVRVARWLLAGFAVLVAVVGSGAMLAASRSENPDESFTSGLLVEPVGYHNAAAALFLLGFWPALLISSRRETPLAVRALLLAVAGVLLSLAIVPQSRGAAIVFPFALALYFAVVPGRARSLLALVPVGVATLATSDAMLDVYRSARAGDAPAGLERALGTLAIEAVVLAAVGAAIAVVDRRVVLAPRTARVATRVTGGAALATAAAAIVVALPADPLARAESTWEEFKGGDRPDEASLHFTSSIGSNRYDFWRVGLTEFRDSPVYGIGADNFAIPYLKHRRSDEEPAYPHSVEVQVLSQLGLVGAILLATFFAAAVFAALRASRAGPEARALGTVTIAACAYWGGHASGDWFWEFPVLTAAALGFLGLGAGLARAARVDTARVPTPALVLGGVAVVTAAASLALPWLAANEVERATAVWRDDPEEAYSRLRRARALDPLSERADLVEGAIASRRRDWPRMRAAFERALERNEESWYAHFELAVVAAVTGDRARAGRELAAAEELNPREPALALLRRGLRTPGRVDPAMFDRLFLERLRERID